MEVIERCLLVKPEVFVYKIPPRQSARGYRAADWSLASPDWTGRLRCVSKGPKCELRLEDKTSGELFAACPVDTYPGTAVEAVTDSSRYFVICIQDAGRKAYIGIGFADRADSFDLNVTLQDHFKILKKEETLGNEPAPKLDLAFKEGQTIKVNINIPKKEGGARPRPSGGGILPPPPGGVKIGPPPSAANLTPLQSPSEPVINNSLGDLLGDLNLASQPPASKPASTTSTSQSDDIWGDFESAPTANTVPKGSWTEF